MINTIIYFAKTIEEEYDTKCYITGKGVMKTLNKKIYPLNNISEDDFIILVEPNEKVLKKGNKLLSDCNVNIVIDNIESFRKKVLILAETLLIDTEENIKFEKTILKELRNRRISVNLFVLMDNPKLVMEILDYLDLRFSVSYDVIEMLQGNLSKKICVDILKRSMDTSSSRIYNFFDDVQGYKKIGYDINSGNNSIIRMLVQLDKNEILRHFINVKNTGRCVAIFSETLNQVDKDKIIFYIMGMAIVEKKYYTLLKNGTVFNINEDMLKDFYNTITEYNEEKINEMTKNVISVIKFYYSHKNIQNLNSFKYSEEILNNFKNIDINLYLATYIYGIYK